MKKDTIYCHTAEYSLKDKGKGMTIRFFDFRINFLTFLKFKKIKGIKTIRRNSNCSSDSLLIIFKKEGYYWEDVFVSMTNFFKENGVTLLIEKMYPNTDYFFSECYSKQ